MKNFIKIIIILIFPLFLCFGFSLQQTFAQENLFDTLDDIKKGVEGSQVRTNADGTTETKQVTLVDFSKDNLWGNLSSEVIDILKKKGYKNIDEIASKAKYTQAKRNVSELQESLKDEFSSLLTENEIKSVESAILYKGEGQIHSAILSIAKVLRNLMGGIAIIFIVISGIIMVTSGGDESKITEQKQSITYAVIGLVIILLIERMINLIYGTPGGELALSTSGKGVSEEIYGVISFIKVVIGVVAILMIMMSGFKIITAQGEEEKITKARKSIIWIALGIVIIIVNKVFVDNLYIKPVDIVNKAGEKSKVAETLTTSNIQAIINQIGTVTQFALGFVGIIAFAALVYGAALLIANFGSEEVKEKAKKIITNALIGIIVILSAYALIATVIKFQ